jgi:CRP-like cAMP-binding protein
MQDRVIKLLRNTVIFHSLPDAALAQIAGIATLERVPKGQVVYQVGEPAKDLYVVAGGQVRHALGPGAQATVLVKVLGEGEVIGWAALLRDRSRRLAKTTALEDTELLRIGADRLMDVLGAHPDAARDVLERCAKMIIEDFTVPAWLAQVQTPPQGKGGGPSRGPGGGSMGNQ